MHVVIAPDKFRGSLNAIEAADAMARGVLAADPTATIDLVPMADGGEGTVEALVTATKGRFLTAEVTGPLGERVEARYGMLGDGSTAVLEMAAASGLVLVPESRRDPSRTTTIGTGELLMAAVGQGAQRIILGIGGSATNDGGAGFAVALGYQLLDSSGNPVDPVGGELSRIARIVPPKDRNALKELRISVACDVENPLCGPRGASAVYGPQKGATPPMIASLDRNLAHLARVIARDLGASVAEIRGAGAAGGLGAGLVAFAGAKLRRGVELVTQAVNLEERLNVADLCLTGEGLIDASSAFGKTAVGVSRAARASGCPTLAVVGAIGPGASAVFAEGIEAYFSLCDGPMPLQDALANARVLLERASEQTVRAFRAGRESRR